MKLSVTIFLVFTISTATISANTKMNNGEKRKLGLVEDLLHNLLSDNPNIKPEVEAKRHRHVRDVGEEHVAEINPNNADAAGDPQAAEKKGEEGQEAAKKKKHAKKHSKKHGKGKN